MTTSRTDQRGMTNQRAVIALSCIVLALVAVLAFALTSMRNFMDLQYAECVERLDFDTAAAESRRVEIVELRKLEEIVASSSLAPEVARATADTYERRAIALEKAVAKQVIPDCERLRPPTLGDVVAGDGFVIGRGGS